MSRTRTRLLALTALALMLVPALSACGSTSSGGGTTAAKKRICLITDTGGLNDRGFNSLANQGLEKAKIDLGVTGSVTESKAATDYVPNLTTCASQGFDLVIAVGFLMQTALGTVAQQYKNINFAIIDGTATDAAGKDLGLSNVKALFFKEQDAGALVGVIAGSLEKAAASPLKGTKVISAVGGIKIPPVDHYIAGYKFGAQQVDSSINVLVGYSNDFADSAKCRDVANSQIANKSEIVFQVAGGCGLGALKAAGEKGVYSIGVDSDQKDSDKSVIASALKKVDVASYTAIKEVVDGSFKGGTELFGLDNGGVGYAPGNITLSQDILDKVKSVSDQIKAGTLTVPTTV